MGLFIFLRSFRSTRLILFCFIINRLWSIISHFWTRVSLGDILGLFGDFIRGWIEDRIVSVGKIIYLYDRVKVLF